MQLLNLLFFYFLLSSESLLKSFKDSFFNQAHIVFFFINKLTLFYFHFHKFFLVVHVNLKFNLSNFIFYSLWLRFFQLFQQISGVIIFGGCFILFHLLSDNKDVKNYLLLKEAFSKVKYCKNLNFFFLFFFFFLIFFLNITFFFCFLHILIFFFWFKALILFYSKRRFFFFFICLFMYRPTQLLLLFFFFISRST